MGIILAATWQLGEVERFYRLLPRLQEAYSGIALALPPEADPERVLGLQERLGHTLIVPMDWSHGRHAALQKALELAGSHVHHTALEVLLPWVERFPEEWQRVLAEIPRSDCLIVGRSRRAWATYPLSVQETERSINNIFSALFGQPVDLGSGVRGFSRPAVLFLLAHSPPGRAPVEAEWPVLLKRAGFAVDLTTVDGLEWEDFPDEEARRQASERYDREIGNWLRRAKTALEVIYAGLEATRREIVQGAAYWREQASESG
ncbi:MAG: hypothetical protein ACP5OO_01540 [Chloroflexia bacterium]